MYVLTPFSFASEAKVMSAMYWDVDVLCQLALHTVYWHSNHRDSERNHKMEFSEDADGNVGNEFYSMVLTFLSDIPENLQLPDLFSLIHRSFDDLLALALAPPPTFSEPGTQISVAKRKRPARAQSAVYQEIFQAFRFGDVCDRD
jgi:hypothetical protein